MRGRKICYENPAAAVLQQLTIRPVLASFSCSHLDVATTRQSKAASSMFEVKFSVHEARLWVGLESNRSETRPVLVHVGFWISKVAVVP